MVDADLDLLRDLCCAPGPTGFEAPAQALVRRRMEPLGTPEGDPLGNVWLSVGGRAPEVAVVAHADQIGLIVTGVDEHGYLSFAKIGGVAAIYVPGRHLVVHGAAGPVRAVGGSRPTHIVPENERNAAPGLDEQFLDIGAADREDALRRVAVGDPVTFTPDFVELAPGVVASQALDDRAGVYCMLRALELYGPRGGAARMTGIATVHEETTFMGARAHAGRIAPHVIVVIDGDFCSDTPAADAKKLAGEIKLGAGPVLARGAGSNAALLALAREVAAAEGIPVQIKAYPAETQTDADELMAVGGAATLSVGLPMRYMHSPTEVAHVEDLEATARLVAALTRRVAEAWAPGAFAPGASPQTGEDR